jgi:formylglycine-generating enzyme required for sulfatase activity
MDASPDAPADAVWFSSCLGMSPICGRNGTSSCCDSKQVTGGTFFRGHDLGVDNAYPDTSSPATVSSFRLDTYEVTVGRFRAFVDAGLGTQANPPEVGAGAHPRIANSGWDPAWNASLAADKATLLMNLKCSAAMYWQWSDVPAESEAMPMTCVDWFTAMAFCAWDGGYLPTEAELNYAAAGGSEQRAYPWSSPASDLTIDCTYANYMPGTFCVDPPNGGLTPVGALSPKGDGLWGQSDLAGNAWEWVLDWYVDPFPMPCDDCAVVSPPMTQRTFRGGIFNYIPEWLRAGYRGIHAGPDARDFNIGFRCARNALP